MQRRESWLWAAPVLVLLLFFGVAKEKERRAQKEAKRERIQLQARQQQWKDNVKAARLFTARTIEEMQTRENQLKNKQRKVKAKTVESRQIQNELRGVASQLWRLKAAKSRLDNVKMPTQFVDAPRNSGLESN